MSATKTTRGKSDYFGLCPVCSNDPNILNVGRDHFAVCHEHKVYWLVGSNLFSSWRDEDPEIWNINSRLLATYTNSDERQSVGTDSQIDNMAMQNELGRMFTERDNAGKSKPKVKISTFTERPTIGTLGDVLKATVEHEPRGCTLITGYSEARWNGLRPGERKLIEIAVEGATACLDPTNAVTIFIAAGTKPATASAVLKAIAKEIKDFDSFERFTPLEPDADDLPF